MEKKVVFVSPPYGDEITNPDLRFLEILVRFVDQEYWCSGAGQAWLVFEANGLRNKLILTFNKEYGFYVEHTSKTGKLFSSGKGDFDHSVTVFVGGDPWKLPSKFFISREEAFEAVLSFCESGGVPNPDTWLKQTDFKWDYGMG